MLNTLVTDQIITTVDPLIFSDNYTKDGNNTLLNVYNCNDYHVGGAGGSIAGSARASKTIDPAAIEGTPSTQTASSVMPPAVVNSPDTAHQVNDAAPPSL